MLRALLFFTFNFLLLLSTLGQVNNFKHLTGKDGLLSDMVNDIIQDKEGFMWFATSNGLCRYDGYDFLNFTHSPSDSNSLSSNFVTSLVEDDNQNIWIGTTYGLNVLDRETFEIQRYYLMGEKAIEYVQVENLMLDSNNCLWIGTFTDGFFCLDIETKKARHYKYTKEDTNSVVIKNAGSFLEDANGNVLIGYGTGLTRFNTEDSTFTTILKNTDVRNLCLNKDGSVFVGIIGPKGNYITLSKDYQIKHHDLPMNAAYKELNAFMDSEGNQWISVRDVGLIYADVNSIEAQILTFDKFNSNGINSNVINAFAEDRWGNVWIGAYDAGVNILEKNGKHFALIQDNYREDGLRNNWVRAMHQDSEGDIWVGTKVGGTLSKFNPDNQTFFHYEPNPDDPTALSNDYIFSIVEDRPGYIWVGTSNGLNLLNKERGTFKHVGQEQGKKDFITDNSIYVMLKDKDMLYTGQAQGMGVYNTITGEVTNYGVMDGEKGLSDHRVRVITKDSRGNIWVGTRHGLNRFNPKEKIFEHFYNNPEDESTLSENIILSMLEDASGILWIGTALGINKYDRENESFKAFTTKDGLPGNAINGILDDEDGNLWISTNNGLCKFDPVMQMFKNYNIHDGLQANEFSPSVYCKTTDGKMLFGGNSGFNIFHPKKVADNQNIPNVVFTNFKLSSVEVGVGAPGSPLTKHISQTKNLTLTHKQSVFTLEYVGLNFSSTPNNHYAYKMEGFKDQWNEVGTKRDATYTNLNPGHYTFRVKASNNDGVWNEEGVSLSIKILPPPWWSWWSISIYILLGLGLVAYLWRLSIKRIHEEKELEHNQQSLQFFINLSHEFRTPLTIILNPITKLLASENIENREAIKNISLSANKLMNLVNQLLDFRKTDLGHFSMHFKQGDIVEFTRQICHMYKGVGLSKGVNLTFETSESDMLIGFDPDSIEKILANLLSNAIKFTPGGGEIIVTLKKFEERKKLKLTTKTTNLSYVDIAVKDSGIGLTHEQKVNVFERFYSKDEGKTGTGIGLNYSRSLVQLHKGSISVESELGKGSTFIVRFPADINGEEPTTSTKEIPLLEQHQFELSRLDSLKYDIATNKKVDVDDAPKIVDEGIPSVLIVEDNAQLRAQLKTELVKSYEVIEAVNGVDGLEKAKKRIPQLIVSDIMMPDKDGLEMCSELKTDIETSHIPVILLTAKNLDEHKIKGYEIGADDYISKPFNMDVLLARISNIMESRSRLKEKFISSHIVLPAYEFTSNKTDEKFLEQITQFAIENISNPEFKVNEIREEVKLSSTHFYDKIKSLTGQNPSNFLRTIRLQYAAELIRKNQGSIKEVAYQVGFNSPSYFTKSFREMYGKTPAEFGKEANS